MISSHSPLRLIPMVTVFIVLSLLASALPAQNLAHLPNRWTHAGTTPLLGASMASVGDLDGDGIGDFAVGVPDAWPQNIFLTLGMSSDGEVRLISGADGTLMHYNRGTIFSRLGIDVVGMGDLNGDGVPDVVATGYYAGATTFVAIRRAISGATGATLYTISDLPLWSSFLYGSLIGDNVDNIGDIDGDGISDFVVSDQTAAVPVGYGAVHVYSGVDGDLIASYPNTTPNYRRGVTAASAGDVNGDGFQDIMTTEDPNPGPARVAILSALDGSVLHTLTGQPGETFGKSVASAGDVNGDGFDDFLIGSSSPSSSHVDLYSGLTGALLFSRSLPPGRADTLSVGGDVNGDGQPDLAIDGTIYSGITGPEITQTPYGSILLVPDQDGDGFSELLGRTISASASSVTLFSQGGAIPYGVGVGANQTLSLTFLPGTGPSGPAAGLDQTTGADPFSVGVIVLSAGEGFTQSMGVTVLVDSTPGQYLYSIFNYDAQGTKAFPLDLRQPVVAGLVAYLQYFELNGNAPQGVYASNGLAFRFTL